MEVEELRKWHVDTSAEDGEIRFLLSENWSQAYQMIKERLIDAGIVSIEFDFLNEIADKFLDFLTVDLGPVSMTISLVGLAIYEITKRVVVTGYRVVRYPAKYGQGRYDMMKFGQGGYTIEPQPLD